MGNVSRRCQSRAGQLPSRRNGNTSLSSQIIHPIHDLVPGKHASGSSPIHRHFDRPIGIHLKQCPLSHTVSSLVRRPDRFSVRKNPKIGNLVQSFSQPDIDPSTGSR